MTLIGPQPSEPSSEGHTGGSCCTFISKQKNTLKYGAAWMTSVHFLPNIFQQLHYIFFIFYLFILFILFAFKKIDSSVVSSLFFSILGRVGVNTRLHVSLKCDKNIQTLYVQRDPHSFIETGSILPPLPIDTLRSTFTADRKPLQVT